MTDHDTHIGFLIQDVARLMRVAFDRRMKEIGLTRAQWHALVSLGRGDGMTQQQLADQMDMERAALSKLLSRLEAGGWIERRPDVSDKRANRIYLASKFKGIMPAMQAEADGLMDKAFSGISAEARASLSDILYGVKQSLLDEVEDPEK